MEPNKNELLKYLRMIDRRKGLFILVALLVTSVFIVGSYFIPKKYRADSTVFIEKSVINNLVKGLAITPDMGDRIRVLKYALLSRELVGRVLDDIEQGPSFATANQKQDFISALQRRTELSIKGNGDLFIVSLVDKDPVFARDYLNTLVRTYVQENLSAKREESYGANRFLDEQLVLFKNKLDKAEDAIIQFRRSQNVYLGNDESSKVAAIRGYLDQIDQIDLDITTMSAKMRLLENQLRNVDPKVALFSGKRRQDAIAFLEDKLGKLLLTYTESYPEVVRIKVELEALRSRQEQGGDDAAPVEMQGINPVYQETLQGKMSLEAEISSLNAKKNKLRQMVEVREKDLREVPEHRKELDRLVQERQSARKIYEELLLRLGQAEVSKQMEIGDKATTFRIVDPAILPRVPVSPNMIRMILLAIAVGLGSGAGLIVLLEQQDSSVKNVDDLKFFGVQVLARIPSIVDEQEVLRGKIRNRWVYATAACYGTAVLGLLLFESLYRLRG
jgi:polysaccharide chain length determinant protein (PEP-CTERM system associated)